MKTRVSESRRALDGMQVTRRALLGGFIATLCARWIRGAANVPQLPLSEARTATHEPRETPLATATKPKSPVRWIGHA